MFYFAGGWWCPGDDHVAAHQPVLVIRETQTRGSRPPLMNKNTVSHLVWRCDGFLFVSCFTICVLLVTISAHVQLVARSSKQKLHLFSQVQDNVRMLFMGVKINNKCFWMWSLIKQLYRWVLQYCKTETSVKELLCCGVQKPTGTDRITVRRRLWKDHMTSTGTCTQLQPALEYLLPHVVITNVSFLLSYSFTSLTSLSVPVEVGLSCRFHFWGH